MLAALALVFVLTGCESDEALAHLIQIDDVTQTWEEPSSLVVHGEGFPHGVRGEALLTGTLYAVGAPAVAVELRAPCRALSGSQALVELNTPEASSLREGPFEGKLELRFGALSAARLVGRSEHVTARVGGLPSALDQRFQLRQRAQAFQRSVGIVGLEMAERGIVISQLAERGAALEAGVQLGDLITRIDGAPVQLPIDVLGHALHNGVELTLQRANETGPRVLKLTGERAARSLPWIVVVLCALLGGSLGFVLTSLARPGALWAPRRREYWLSVVPCASLLLLAGLLLDSLDPIVRELALPFAYAFACGALAVCLQRRVRPTLRTRRDPGLAPLL